MNGIKEWLDFLSEQEVEKSAALLDATDDPALNRDWLECLNEDKQEELCALMWFGGTSNPQFDWEWHYGHYIAASNSIKVEISAQNLREGLRRLKDAARR